MMDNWYASIGGQSYGPYKHEDVRQMLSKGELKRDTLIFHESIGSWQPVYAVSQFSGFVQNESQPQAYHQSYPPHPGPVKPKKKYGCLKGCLSVFLVVVLVITGFAVFGPKGPQNLDLARASIIERAVIEASGGVIDAGEIKIEVPEGAYSKKTNFKISTREIKEHRFGDSFNPVGPVYQVENKGKYAEEPMTVTIPINISDDEFAMAFFYNDDGSLEPMPLIYQDSSQVIVSTKHFSEFLVTKIEILELMEMDIDTGFRPGVDDWSFANYGSQISNGGHCAGQSVSMAYYYTEMKTADDSGLFMRYDNNTQQVKTPQFDRDDSLGIRLSSVVQEEGRWSSYYFDFILEQIHRQKYVSDRLMYYAFAYSMHLTGEPQVLGIFVRDDNAEEEITLNAGHAVVIYRADQGTLHVADPNFPGNANLTFSLDGETLGPYVSRTAADRPDRLYNSFSLVGKTALFDYATIGRLFKEMDKPAQTAELGNDKFGGSGYSVLVDVNEDGEDIWAEEPELVVFEEDAKNRIRDKYRRSLNAPQDWNSQDYMIVSCAAGVNHDGFIKAYSGVTEVAKRQAQGSNYVTLYVPVKGGVNDTGLAFFDRGVITYQGRQYYSDKFMHFYRIKVENGEVDLTGTWTGTMQLTDIGGALDYGQWLGELIAKGLMQFLAPAFGVDIPSDEEISQAVRDSIEVNEAALEPFPMVITLTQVDKENYRANITVTADGTVSEHDTNAVYKGGKLIFTTTYEDGSAAEFTMTLYDNNVLAGDFEINMGMFQSITGESYLYR